MDWKDIGKQIAGVAPVLGAAVGGPIGGAAGALIASIFGVDSEPEAVSKAIKEDPESALKLIELEQKHEQSLRKMALDERKAELADTQQARQAHQGAWMPWALTIIIAAMVAGMTAGLMWLQIPTDNKEVVYLLVGQLLGGFSTAISFWLGSSRGSVVKDTMLKR